MRTEQRKWIKSIGWDKKPASEPHQSTGPLLNGAIGMAHHPSVVQANARNSFCDPLPTDEITKKKARILIAEDNSVNQLMAMEVVAKYGYACDAVDDGAKAVAAALSGKYDLVLMDCSMPGVDGLEATRRIRLAEKSASANQPRHIPIIALTANEINGDRERCIEAGMDGYQTKPLVPQELMQAIAALLAETDTLRTAVKESAEENMNSGKNLPSTDLPAFAIDELLTRCMDNAEAVVLILNEFEKQVAGDLEAIKRSVASGDCEETAQRAHALKGASGMLAAASLADIACRLEQLGRSGSLTGAESLVDDLGTEIQRLIESLPDARAAAVAKRSTKQEV